MPATGFIDACGFNPASGGTGAFVVSAAITGYQTPASAGAANGAVYAYRAQSLDLSQWEIGFGTYNTSTTTLARTTITANSAGTTAAISFSAPPNVYCTALSADLINVASTGSGYVNKFRNPGQDVDQRATRGAALTVTTAGGYVTDGWIVVPTGASCTAQQAASQAGMLSANSLKVIGAASVTDILVKQRIEGWVAAPLAGGVVTVQAKVYNNTGASLTPTLTVKHANAVDNWSAATTDVSAANLQTCASGTTTTVAYTFTASSAAGNGLEVTFDFGNNFGSTGKTLQVGDCDIRVTPYAPPGLNAVPPAPEMRPMPAELAYCQRYFIAYTAVGAGVNFNANWGANVWYPTVMRANPQVFNASFPTGGGTFAGAVSVYGYQVFNSGGAWGASPATTSISVTAQFSAEL